MCSSKNLSKALSVFLPLKIFQLFNLSLPAAQDIYADEHRLPVNLSGIKVHLRVSFRYILSIENLIKIKDPPSYS